MSERLTAFSHRCFPVGTTVCRRRRAYALSGASAMKRHVGRREKMLCSKRIVKSNMPGSCGPNLSSLMARIYATLCCLSLFSWRSLMLCFALRMSCCVAKRVSNMPEKRQRTEVKELVDDAINREESNMELHRWIEWLYYTAKRSRWCIACLRAASRDS